MREKANIAWGGKRRREESGVERIVRVQQADAVRPEDADLVLARDSQNLIFERRACWTDLAESARHDDRGADAARAAVRQRGGHGRGRDDQHRQIHGVGDLGQRRAHRETHQRPAFGVDEMDRAFILTLDQVARHAVAELGRVCGCADDGDAARGEEGEEGFSHQSSVISHQSSVISHQSSVISHQLSVIELLFPVA